MNKNKDTDVGLFLSVCPSDTDDLDFQQNLQVSFGPLLPKPFEKPILSAAKLVDNML